MEVQTNVTNPSGEKCVANLHLYLYSDKEYKFIPSLQLLQQLFFYFTPGGPWGYIHNRLPKQTLCFIDYMYIKYNNIMQQYIVDECHLAEDLTRDVYQGN